MALRFYTHHNLPADTVVELDGRWFVLPSTLTTPAAKWAQRREIPAPYFHQIEEMPQDGLFARMMRPAVIARMTAAEFAAGRKSLGLTQTEAATVFGRKLRQVQNWESTGPDDLAARYMAALLAGHRPPDWPQTT